MNCKDIEQSLIAFSEGTLSGSDRKRFEEHLKECPSCAQLAAAFPALWEQVAAPADAELSPCFRTRLQGRIDEYERSARSKTAVSFAFRIIKPVAHAALLVFGIVSGYALGSYYTEITALEEAVRTPAYVQTFEALPEGSLEEVYYNFYIKP